MYKYFILMGFFVFNMVQSYASTQAKFALVAYTQTNVTVPKNRHVYIQYKVTNNTPYERTLTIVPIPGVKQVTLDSSQCPNPTFVLAANGGNCKLTLYVDGATLGPNYKHYGGPVVCKTQANSNKPDSFLCSQPELSMFLSIKSAPPAPYDNKMYVSNWDGNSISLCYIQSGNLTACLVSAVSGTFANPEAVAINSGNDILFVANIGGGVSSCHIDPNWGELFNCASATVLDPSSAAKIYKPDGISIVGSTAYISNAGPAQFEQGVTVCTVSGDQLTGCNFGYFGSEFFSIPSDLAVIGTGIYTTNYNYQNVPTAYCSTTSTGHCENTIGTDSLLNKPEGIFFAPSPLSTPTKAFAYFTNNGNNTVVVCQIDPSQSDPVDFNFCEVTGGHFEGFGNLAVLSSPLKAFIPSGLKTLASCDVDFSSGALSHCVNSAQANFNNPSGVIIQ